MHILVIRLSAMGDVAMTVPVVVEALAQNPDLKITVLSRKPFDKFFPLSERLNFVAMDTKGEHKGLVGIRKMFKQLRREYDFNAVADLHNVLRSNVLTKYFNLTGIRSAKIDKGRSEKKKLTKKETKERKALKHSTQRYVEVFKKLGLKLNFDEHQRKPYLNLKDKAPVALNKVNIGFAPFAQHAGKAYPWAEMKTVIADLAANPSVNIYLFGGGAQETEMINEVKGGNVISMAGSYSLTQELAQMRDLDLMVSMDSSNMHMASLVGTRVVSIWGATHHFAGFLGVGQSAKDIVEIPTTELDCRPCSVFGNKPCFRKDLACMNRINPSDINHKINAALNH